MIDVTAEFQTHRADDGAPRVLAYVGFAALPRVGDVVRVTEIDPNSSTSTVPPGAYDVEAVWWEQRAGRAGFSPRIKARRSATRYDRVAIDM